MANPTSALVNFLDGNGNLSLTKGTNLFQGMLAGPNDRIPVNCVFVYPTGGAEPVRTMGLVTEHRFSTVAVMTRNSKFASGDDTAQDIQKELQDAAISGFLDIKALESTPVHLGQDENGHYLFMSNLQLVYEETA